MAELTIYSQQKKKKKKNGFASHISKDSLTFPTYAEIRSKVDSVAGTAVPPIPDDLRAYRQYSIFGGSIG